MFYEGYAIAGGGGAFLAECLDPVRESEGAEGFEQPLLVAAGAAGAAGYCFAAGRHGGFSG